MFSYAGLLQKLNEKGLTRSSLVTEPGVSTRTVAKIGRGEKIANHVLDKIASFLGCSAEELCSPIPDNVLLQTLRDEKSIRTYRLVGGALPREQRESTQAQVRQDLHSLPERI